MMKRKACLRKYDSGNEGGVGVLAELYAEGLWISEFYVNDGQKALMRYWLMENAAMYGFHASHL